MFYKICFKFISDVRGAVNQNEEPHRLNQCSPVQIQLDSDSNDIERSDELRSLRSPEDENSSREDYSRFALDSFNFSCAVCKKLYREESQLLKHIKKHENKVNDYSCNKT